MAKTAKKTARKTAKKSAKVAKKPARAAANAPARKAARSTARPMAKKTAKKTARKAAGRASGPKKVSSGRGATPGEIGRALVEHFNAMQPDTELWKRHFHPRFVSIEGSGESWAGVKAIGAKCRAWMDAHVVHSARATGPFVGATGFAVEFEMDVESKDGSMPRTRFREIGVYTVKNGKVVQEEFMYGGM